MLKAGRSIYILQRRGIKELIIRRDITTLTSSPSTTNFPIYKSFLDDLKNKKDEGVRPSVHTKSYADIDSKAFSNVTEEQKKEIKWSSQYDPVTRSPFAKDVIHLQSLLDALLSSKNFERADKILKAIHPLLASPETFIFSINKYLETWALEESVLLKDVQTYISNIERKYPDVQLNDRTHAILLSKHITVGEPYSKLLATYPTSKTRKIFSHIDILGVEALMLIFKDEGMTESHVPTDFIHLFREVRNEKDLLENEETPEYFRDDLDVPTIEKDSETLRAVDSFGLKIIRHTLLGLKEETGSHEFEKIMKGIENELTDHLLHNTSIDKRDFFKLHQSLQTQEQKDKFDEALDIFNEARQRQLEVRGVDGAKEKWKHEFEDMQKRGGLSLNKGLNAQLFKWYSEFLPYLEKEVEECKALLNGDAPPQKLTAEEKQIRKDREYYAPYLVLVPPKKMSVITILELLKLNSTGGIIDGMRAARALISVGRAIELEYRSQSLLNTEKKAYSKKLKTTNQWKKMLRHKKSVILDDPSQTSEWSYTIYAKLGSVLTSLLMHVAKVPVKAVDPTTGKTVYGVQPAFHHTYQFLSGQKLGVLKIHKEVIRQLAGKSLSNCVQPQLLPMLVPPRPWSSHNDGGYLYSQTALVRIKDSPETSAYLRAASEMGNLDEVYDGLNVLGNTPWTVNRNVFEVITKYWNTGEKFLDIPPIVVEPELPEPLPLDAEPQQKFEYQKRVRAAVNFAASARSQRCDTNYKLEIARGFLGEKLFFPHNVDFRGRAYPLSPHFNHLGNDLTRSLFLFWKGKEVGESGLRWLKIHLANVYGIDKAPLHERHEFVDKNLEQVFESAKDPYNPDAWWLKAEKPWQTLSVCFELYNAYQLEDPTKFVSHMPVHQDGTCNGLQHYAALGGDIEGARQVNLLPAERPQDVYTFVSSLVQKRIDDEAEQGDKHAIFLKDKITRKVVKQTVMTNVYGVTFVGAAAQIKKQLDHHFEKDDVEDAGPYARYLTLHVFASIRELFEGAHLIQDWLGESAKRISKSVRIDYEEDTTKGATNKPNHLSSVIWTTPLGLPCVQPYRVTKSQLVKTNLQDITISDPFGASQVDARKQQAAFPPNFVHSLDATHMLMTSKACGDAGLSFAAVHDSYWTHASDVDIMNKEIRNQFVNLHENNLIEQVRDEFEKRYKGCLQVISISGDHEVAKKIKEVRRNIVKSLGRALTVADEIYLEKKRLQLLESSDPKVVQMGQDMVTTISVTEGQDMNKLTVGSGSARAFQILVPLKFPDIPQKGDLDVNLVKDALYFFS